MKRLDRADKEDRVAFTKFERLLLYNQYLILEKLNPEEAEFYEQQQEILVRGYELDYKDIDGFLSEGISEDECREVRDILNMYRDINFSNQKLPTEERVSDDHARFKGFDGNEEPKYYGYARFLIISKGRFEELRYGQEHPDLNSHFPYLRTYRKMLAVWKTLGGERRLGYLARDEIMQILDV